MLRSLPNTRSEDSQARVRVGSWLVAALALGASALSAHTARAFDVDASIFSGRPMLIGDCLLPNNGGFFTALFVMQGRTAVDGYIFGSGLGDDIRVVMGPDNDNLTVQGQALRGSSSPVDGCFEFGPPSTRDHGITLEGGDGDDVLICGGGSCVAFGGNGDDTLYCGAAPEALLNGEEGNDTIWSCQRSTTETLIGAAGDDAICLSGGDTELNIMIGGDGEADCSNIPFGFYNSIETLDPNQDCAGRCSRL